MRIRWKAALLAVTLAAAPASAQVANDTGIPTETQERLRAGNGPSNDFWNLIGLLGILGLAGLWRESDNDGYTDDPI